jgi:ribosome maturation factor RimP
MYPNPGGYKTGRDLKRLPEVADWERLQRELEDKMEPLIAGFGPELDQVEFTVEGGEPTVNLYYSTKPQGLRKHHPELDPMVMRAISLIFDEKAKEVLGEVLT